MARPERIESLDDVKTWIADHDGRIDQLWLNQKEMNSRTDSKFDALNHRLTSLEKRIVFVAGGASALGSGVGFALLNLIA